MPEEKMKTIEFEFPEPDDPAEIQVEPAQNRTENVLQTLDLEKKVGKEAAETAEKEDVRVVQEGSVEIEVENDTPKKDRIGKQASDVEDVSEGELNNYSKRVQKRMKDLNTRYHDQRREAEARARERDEIVNLAKSLMDENEKLKQTTSRSRNSLIKQAKDGVAVELASAQREYKDAYDSGDSDRLVQAQTKLSEVVAKKAKIDAWKPQPLQRRQSGVQPQQRTTPTQQEARPQQPAPQPQVPPNPKVQEWMSDNAWFGTDEEMTSFAYGVHQKLVREGVDGTHPDYYKRLDARIREKFPEEFDIGKGESSADNRDTDSVVAPVTRSSAPKKFRLNETQVALAKRLGVSLEDYAKEAAKLEMRKG